MNTKQIFNSLKEKITPAKIFFFITLCLVIFVRLRLLSMPLDRDEGGWAYAAWLILNGEPPFKYFYDTKMPLIYFIYVVIITIFGQTIEGVRIGILFTVIINMYLIFKVFTKISGNKNGSFMACAFYGLLSLDAGTLSLSGYSTHFVLTFFMLSLIFLLSALDSEKRIIYFISGFFAGMAFIVKQTAIFFFLFSLIYLIILNSIYYKKRIKLIFIDIIVYIIGAFLVFLFVCLIMKAYGVFDRFWFMTIEYAIKYGNAISFHVAWKNFLFFFNYISIFFKAIFVIYLIYFFVLIFFIRNLYKITLHVFLFLSAFAFSMSVFYFYPHYFIVFFLPIALLLAENFSDAQNKELRISDKTNIIVYIFLVILLIFSHYDIFFRNSPQQVSRKLFTFNPFPESIEIAQFIKENTNKEDKIAILGSEPQILFYSKRKSATGYVYFNQLMQQNELSDKMQLETIHEIEKANPKFLIFVNIITSWVIDEKSSKRVLLWFENKIRKKEIELVGCANIISSEKTEYIWGKEAVEKYISLHSNCSIEIFKVIQK